ncbi:hypothetical protein [Acidisoma sp. L85]|uniref:hypothetical protein n=1 Tax=Acidisoma sp. L85 TaxID=1641850 RepID=UPI00131ECE66|nr:hypothetical protein [Acidisoma sp. L85]
MKVVSIGPDAVALEIDSASDHVGSLTPEQMARSHVSDAVVAIYRRYFNQTHDDEIVGAL